MRSVWPSVWGVEGSGRVPFYPKQPVQVLHELGLKLRAPVMDELPRNAMQLEHIVPVQLGHPLSSERCVSGKDMDLFAEPVHKDTNGIVSTGFRKFTNEVHRDHLPWLFGDLIRLKGSMREIPVCLGALASFTAIHIHPDILLKAWPPVFMG